jgi:hypothetical protein
MTFCPFTNRIAYGLLTNEEKKILEAKGPWEIYTGDLGGAWKQLCDPRWLLSATYRRKKMPVIRRVEMYTSHPPGPWGYTADTCKSGRTHKIKFNVVDGEVDVFSCVMEKL